jgi:hypothetical protein
MSMLLWHSGQLYLFAIILCIAATLCCCFFAAPGAAAIASIDAAADHTVSLSTAIDLHSAQNKLSRQ